MPVELKDLLNRRDELKRQIQVAKTAARPDAIAVVRQLRADHGLEAADLAANSSKRGPPEGKPVAP